MSIDFNGLRIDGHAGSIVWGSQTFYIQHITSCRADTARYANHSLMIQGGFAAMIIGLFLSENGIVAAVGLAAVIAGYIRRNCPVHIVMSSGERATWAISDYYRAISLVVAINELIAGQRVPQADGFDPHQVEAKAKATAGPQIRQDRYAALGLLAAFVGLLIRGWFIR